MKFHIKELFRVLRRKGVADLVREGVCPNCKCSDKWLLGPRGGCARNIKCDNCGEVYNVSPIGVEWRGKFYPYRRLKKA